MKYRITLLYGGRSGEHEVSCISAYYVYSNLDRSKYEISLVGIDKAGCWYLQRNVLTEEKRLLINKNEKELVAMLPGKGLYVNGEKLESDFVFPVLHGSFGEDGTVQGALELLDLAYAGSSVLGSALAMSKELIKDLWISKSLPVLPYVLFKKADYLSNEKEYDKLKIRIASDIKYPLIVKPSRVGSSVGISKVDRESELKDALDFAFKYDTKLLIEPFIQAREIECSVIGNECPISFTPGEIIPNHEFYDYEAKYKDPDGAAFSIPARLEDTELKDLQRIAEQAYAAAEIEGFARVDFFKDKISGNIYLNEINTIPGFTSISMFPVMCEKSGLKYSDLLDRIIDYGLKRQADKNKLQFEL